MLTIATVMTTASRQTLFLGKVEDGVAGNAHTDDGVEANPGKENPVKADDFEFSVGQRVCAVTLGN